MFSNVIWSKFLFSYLQEVYFVIIIKMTDHYDILTFKTRVTWNFSIVQFQFEKQTKKIPILFVKHSSHAYISFWWSIGESHYLEKKNNNNSSKINSKSKVTTWRVNDFKRRLREKLCWKKLIVCRQPKRSSVL